MDMPTSLRAARLRERSRRFASRPGILARAAAPSFTNVLDRIDASLTSGTLHAQLPDGTQRALGGRERGFECKVELHSWNALLRLATSGSVGWYQAWEAGEWTSPDPIPLFALFMQHAARLGDTARAKGLFRLALKVAHLVNRNTHKGAKKNIGAHYDLGNDFYRSWLDPTMTYSSAMAVRDSGSLESAQRRKWARLSERIGPAAKVLEIGCGWGSLAAHLAQEGRRVTAISLSDEQLAFARHTGDGVAFLHQDYRDVKGQYDAIVSVEMIEALGQEYWPTFLDSVDRLLKPGGRAALQFISMRDDLFDAYASSADFIQAYIFPGGLLIRAAELRRLAVERGLSWEEEERFGDDYAETLKLWRANFDAAVAQNRLPAGFDRQFVELWRYYLMYCEGGFRGGGIDVHQVTLRKGETQ